MAFNGENGEECSQPAAGGPHGVLFRPKIFPSMLTANESESEAIKYTFGALKPLCR
jgi:hypothetical protein